MSIEADFRALLAGDMNLVALVGANIALNAVDDAAAGPVVVFSAVHNRTLGLDNSLLADQCTLTVQCWADTASQAEAVADAVVAAVAKAPRESGAVVLDRASAFDAELGMDGTVLTVEWWV